MSDFQRMKVFNLIVTGLLVVSAPWSYGQNEIDSTKSVEARACYRIDNPNGNVLYRGYENLIVISDSESVAGYTLFCQNCKEERVLDSEDVRYTIRPGSGKMAKISIHDALTSDLIFEKEFRVTNLPDPMLYLEASKSGQSCSKSATLITAKYPPEISLTATFTIVRWEIQIGDEYFMGTGSNLTEDVMEYWGSLEKSGLISLLCTVRGPDGIARQIGGAFSFR